MKDWILSWGLGEWVVAWVVLISAWGVWIEWGAWPLPFYPMGTAVWALLAGRWWRRLRRYEECARWEPHLHPDGCTAPCKFEFPGQRGDAWRRVWQRQTERLPQRGILQ